MYSFLSYKNCRSVFSTFDKIIKTKIRIVFFSVFIVNDTGRYDRYCHNARKNKPSLVLTRAGVYV